MRVFEGCINHIGLLVFKIAVPLIYYFIFLLVCVSLSSKVSLIRHFQFFRVSTLFLARETSDSIQSAGSFSPRRVSGQPPTGFSSGHSTVQSPAGLSSGFSNRSSMQSGGFSSVRLSASRALVNFHL